jgi:hypothetical protein
MDCANLVPASSSGHEAELLPSIESDSYIKDFPWSALYSSSQLATHDWHDLDRINL